MTGKEIGALWIKKNKKGKNYLRGIINGVNVVVLTNIYKRSALQPDFRVFPSTWAGGHVRKGEDKIGKKDKMDKMDKMDEEDIPF